MQKLTTAFSEIPDIVCSYTHSKHVVVNIFVILEIIRFEYAFANRSMK